MHDFHQSSSRLDRESVKMLFGESKALSTENGALNSFIYLIQK